MTPRRPDLSGERETARQGRGPSTAVPLLDAAAARAGDAAAVTAGVAPGVLMERAAGHLARAVVAAAGRGYGLKVAVLVGSGNNGGDGWAAARRLGQLGAQAWVVAPGGADRPGSPETEANRQRWRGVGGRVSAGVQDLTAVLDWADVAVDCLLGTGAKGPPRDAARSALEILAVARQRRGRSLQVIACDVPSGVSADDGSVADVTVGADVTVTFGGMKRGLALHPGAEAAGRVVIGDLGPEFAPPPSQWAALTPQGARAPSLSIAADKRARGTVVAVAGGRGTAGAAALTASAALAAGAGLVTACVPEAVRDEVASRLDPGVMLHGLVSDERGAIRGEAVDDLPEVDHAGAVVAGPGLGYGAGAAAVVEYLKTVSSRLVLDADALNVHRDNPATLADHAGSLVLTPHARELARIGGGADEDEALRRRVARVPELAARYDATIVAKGPGTIVAAPDGRVWVTPLGGPALGSGGTGDVLAGIVAAAIASADDVPLAVARAVWWHAAAGLLAGAARAERGTAREVLRAVPQVLGALDAATTSSGSHQLPWDGVIATLTRRFAPSTGL